MSSTRQAREVFEPKSITTFFAGRVETYLQSLRQKRGDILDLVEAGKAPEPALAIENNLTLKRAYQEALSHLENRRIEVRTEYEHMGAALAESDIQLFSFIDNETIRAISTDLRDLINQHAAEGNHSGCSCQIPYWRSFW